MVPDTVMAEPGATVCPGAITKAAVPSFTVALTTFCSPPPTVRTGDGPERVDVAPFTTRTEPDAEDGIEYVVPDTVIAEPGARVCSGAIANAVVPSLIVALTTFCSPPPTVRAGADLARVDVAPLTTSTEPDAGAGIEYVVPETVKALPGTSVCPAPTTKAVVPSFTEALILLCPSSVRAGEAALSVEVAPFATTTEPEPDAGIENVVPELVTTPPGVRVIDGPRTNAGVPPMTLAGTATPPSDIVGFSVIAGEARAMVCVTPFTMSWEPPPDVGTITVAPLMLVVWPALTVREPITTSPGAFGAWLNRLPAEVCRAGRCWSGGLNPGCGPG